MDAKPCRVEVNGTELAYLTLGEGPLALCLHGFPDGAWTWRHLAPDLVAAGFRVVAPFLRGYAPSAVPADGRFQTAVLGQDANALHDALGGDEHAVLIGHDWGAAAAYSAAIAEPERWNRLVGLSVPPGNALAEAFRGYPQLKRSWYMFFFLHPLADAVVGLDDLAFVDELWADWSPGFDATEELERVKPSLRDPANLVAALGYYRAALGGGHLDPALAPLQARSNETLPRPTLYLHGAQDGCIGADLATSAVGATPAGSEVAIIDGVGHFLHLEQPEEVNGRILRFVTA